MKIRLIIIVFLSNAFAFVGCNSEETTNTVVDTNENSSLNVDSTGFDWSVAPLKVNIVTEGLVSEMEFADLDSVKTHVYNYFHLQQTGNSADYVKHFDYYPSMFDNNEAQKTAFLEATIKWWNMGYRNIFESVDINYASDWIYEEDQKVALIGFDLKFRTEFSEKYPYDPKVLIETLQRQMPQAEIEFIDEEPIRSIVAYDTQGLFIYTPLDEFDFAFLNQREGSNNNMDSLMLRDTRLNLLREKREALK